MNTSPAQTKTVAEFHTICEHDGCSRRVMQPNGSYTKRMTTCRRHMPETGYVLQVKREGEAQPRTAEVVGAELKAAWKRSDYGAVRELNEEYRLLTDRPMTADERRIAERLA
jgi:hypothetical protein